jgi:chitinase
MTMQRTSSALPFFSLMAPWMAALLTVSVAASVTSCAAGGTPGTIGAAGTGQSQGAAGTGAAGTSAGASGSGMTGAAGTGTAGTSAVDGGSADVPVNNMDAAKDTAVDKAADLKPAIDVSDAKPVLDSGLPSKGLLAVYWGQNGWGATHTDQATWEKPLAETCTAHPEYDIVILSFATKLTHTRNMTTTLPELNFANHCEIPYDANNPFLLKCDEIAAGIRTCQELGKKVLLSIGGATGSAGFVDDAEARASATTVWNTFLGGTSAIRPFVNATLDGVDLDIEGGPTVGYTAFVKALRPLMDNSGRKYFITAAPQCPFPDAFVGPATGKPLGDAPGAFDFVFVQFYNNYCSYGTPQSFRDTFAMWKALVGPKVFVGLPATTGAATSGFVPRAMLQTLVGDVKADPKFAGIMLWDASNDQNSVEGGTTYGAYAKSLIK